MFILATATISVGFLVETFALVQISLQTGHGPYTSPFEYCVFSAWTIIAVFLVAEGYYKIKPLGVFMVPIALLMMLIAFSLPSDPNPMLPVKEYWLTLHRTMSFMSFATFAMIFASGVMYLILEKQLKSKHLGGWYYRLPSLDAIDDINRKGIVFGFPVSTLAVAAAFVWSIKNYGVVINLELSVAILLVGWLVYAILGLGRLAFGWRGKRTATLGIVGFLILSTALIVHIH